MKCQGNVINAGCNEQIKHDADIRMENRWHKDEIVLVIVKKKNIIYEIGEGLQEIVLKKWMTRKEDKKKVRVKKKWIK